MKNILSKLTLFLFVLVATFGCQDHLESLYQDPDGFSKEQADAAGVSVIAGYFTSQLTRGFLYRGDYGSVYHLVRSGSPILGTGMQAYNVTNNTGASYTLRDVESDWGSNAFNRNIFNQIQSNWIRQVLWAQSEFNNTPVDERTNLDVLFMNLLHVTKAQAYQRATDEYDMVPYFQTGSAGALEGDRAEYLGQEQIYPIIIQELSELDAYLEGLTLTDQEQSIFSRQDVIFNGDIMQWRKYINSLRLRAAITISEVRNDLTQTVISELSGKPLLSEYNDVAGLADIAIVAPHRLSSELGITRSFRERPWEQRAPKKFIHDVMHVIPNEESIVVNGQTLYYFDGDNAEEGLANGTVDPRVAYIFSTSILGTYIGLESTFDDGTDRNSYFSKAMRGYYINHPIMTDIDVHSITFGPEGFEQTINLNEAAQTDLSLREEFLLNAFRSRVANQQDHNNQVGRNRNMISEYNVRPQFNWDVRYPIIHAVETELSLAEAAVRGFGTTSGTARDHYKRAIELSCEYWYDLNVSNPYSKGTTPGFPGWFDEARLDRDRPGMQYDASAFAEYEAQRFDGLSEKDKVQAIFNQMHLHYNHFNWEASWTAARRLIKYLGDNPANPYEIFEWKERMLYNPNVQSSDPEGWAIISPFNDYNLPVWFTGRNAKWRNVLE